MRLLHFDDPKRLVLTDFSGKPLPPYAILSHRWGDSEVLFEDVRSNTSQEKKGYRKIEFCAEQAAQDQLRYFWIDTCCIDKWNHRERSKAINSMFRWYKNATKCYVFLPDVSVSTTTEIGEQSSWEASFRASEWFTRGWTLQELIAPVSVEFFSSEGRRIGDKRSLEQLVHEITNIPVEALQNCPLDSFTKSERMRWARNRKTKEEEDKIYCLLGMLDIFMPTSYGEGEEMARERLQREVEAANEAPSLIPFSRNYHFVGRESQLAELEAKLFGGKQTTMIAIVGPGGTGKSQLALELAHRTRQKNKNCFVFWIDASDIDSLHQSYASIGQKLDVPGWDDEKTDIKQLVKLHLSRKGARQSLLIFDNTNSINLGSSGLFAARAANLLDYLPQSELCSIIFTTTNTDTAKRLASQDIVELGELTLDTAERMLENYLNAPVSRCEQQEVKLLLRELSCLPLAIVQAAAYINIRNITLHNYRLQLLKEKEEAPARSSDLSDDKLQGHGTEGPVTTTFLISMYQISGSHSLATTYLVLAACMDRKDIPLDLLGESSPREREDAINVLNSYALITKRPAESSLDLHQLVHRAFRRWLQKHEMLDQWTQLAIARLLRVFPDYPDYNYGSRSKWRRLLPHAKYALSHILPEQEGVDRMNLVYKYALALHSDGCYNESEELFVQVIKTRKRVLGEEHPDTLNSIANLATTYRNQGRWKEAEELEVQVMETRKRVLGEEHPDMLTSMANLAATYGNQGRWKEAEKLEVQVMEARKRVLGEEHPSMLNSIANLAATYRNQGRWKEAEKLEVQVMEAKKRVLGEEHPSTLISMANLALTFLNQGRWKEAEELFVQVVETSKKVLGEEHPSTLISMANLASTFWNQGRWKEAEELFMQMIETRKRVLGEEHPSTLTSIANLALTFWNQGRWKEAEELFVQVVETSKKVLGEEHPSTLTSMANLAATYRNQGRWKEAEELFMQMIETRKRVLGEEHPSTLTSIANLASTYANQGRWKEAEELFMQVRETRKRVLGEEHPSTLTSMANLASTYTNQGRWEKAEELEVQVMETRKRVLGEEHPDTLTSMANLAYTWKSEARNNDAILLMEKCVELQKRILGTCHPDTEASLEALNQWQMVNLGIRS
jgi:tetratricopeptide (TPR) repeat protein